MLATADDVRLNAVDSRIEKDESHPGKIVERRWYERNKHIFPASRWEVSGRGSSAYGCTYVRCAGRSGSSEVYWTCRLTGTRAAPLLLTAALQIYDPTVVRERYTTHGEEVNVVKSKHDPGLAPLKGFAPTH